MINTDSISPGENLKRIRKKLGLRQRDIVGAEITRNLISLIENGKSPMNYRIAQIVASNINRVSKERNLGVYINPKDIMDPKRIDAKKKCDEYIEELKKYIQDNIYDLDEKYIKEIIDFLNQWKISEKKVEVYELLGDICYLNGDSKWEYVYLNKALENYYVLPVKNDIHILGRKLISSCINNERYNEAISLCNLDIMYGEHLPKEFQATICYNKALAYKRIKNYDKALKLLDCIEKNYNKTNQHILSKSLILKGTCYYEKDENKQAIEIYKNILEIFGKNSEEAGLAYSNIITIFRKLDLKDEVIEYKDKLIDILDQLEKNNNKHLMNIYLRLGQAFEYLDNIELAEYYYITAINKGLDRKENNKCSKILFNLLNLYTKTNQSEKIFLSNNIFLKGFENSPVSNEMKLAFSLILTNMRHGRAKAINDIISNILKEGIKNED